MNVRRSIPLALAGTGLVLATSAGPALADSSPTPTPTASRSCSADALAAIKAHVHAAVTAREVTLDQLTKALAARTHVSDAHRATLDATFAADASGLRTVDATVQGDTTCTQARTDGRTVVTSFRVYLLVVPQAHLVSAADTGSWAAGRLAAAEPKVQAAVDALSDPAKKAEAQARLDDMTAQGDAATTSLDGVADAMLALVPADIPAQEPAIDGYRAKVASAHVDLGRAVADAKALKSLLGNA